MPVEHDILAVERRRIQAMVDKDVETLASLLGDNLTYTHSGGRIDRKATFLSLITDPDSDYEGVDYSDTEVIDAGDSVLVRGRAQIRLRRASGERLSYPVWFLDVYVQREGRWQMVAWQATRAPDAPT